MQNFYIKTYGCQMNIYDSDKIVSLLKKHNYRHVNSISKADLIVINTCHIREKATERVYSEIGRLPKFITVIIVGCVAQAEGKEIIKRANNVDIILGPQSYHNLPILLKKLHHTKKRQIDLNFYGESKFNHLKIITKSQYSSFITIQEGCDKFCHFCCVPYTRGQEFSRSSFDIINEVNTLIDCGTQEITLLGQNVTTYYNVETLATLFKKLVKIPGLKRLRYITSHPMDIMNSELFTLHANERKIMPYLHLPIQSGSDKILKAMNRKYSRNDYLAVIKKFQDLTPNISFSSDFIVGYPGEAEKDFQDTINLIEKVKFNQCYSFKYSSRPGTVSYLLTNQINEKIKSKRLYRLQQLLQQKQLNFNKSFIGKMLPVLFEKITKKSGQILGKSPYLQSVITDNSLNNIGSIQNVLITDAHFAYLQGKITKNIFFTE